MVRITIILAILCIQTICNTNICFGQRSQYAQDKECQNIAVRIKTQELMQYYEKQGFVVYQGGNLTVDNKTELPVYMQLFEKKVYAIIVVGHPDLQRLEVKLGHRAFGGNEVNDQIIKNRDHTYFTHFVYTPPFTGAYLFTIYEKVPDLQQFCSSIFVLVRKTNVSTPDE